MPAKIVVQHTQLLTEIVAIRLREVRALQIKNDPIDDPFSAHRTTFCLPSLVKSCSEQSQIVGDFHAARSNKTLHAGTEGKVPLVETRGYVFARYSTKRIKVEPSSKELDGVIVKLLIEWKRIEILV